MSLRTGAAALLLFCAACLCACSRRADAPPQTGAIYHAALVDSFASHVSSPNGKPDVQQLKTKKYLFVYFAAHWSDSSVKFTAKLIAFYNDVRKNGDDDIGVIFVPTDRTQYDANTFMKDTAMPWLGVRVNTLASATLQERYAGPNVPCLVLLDGNDEVVASSYNKAGKYLSARAILAYKKLKKAGR